MGGLVELGCVSFQGARNVARFVATGGSSRASAGVRRRMDTALTSGNVHTRMLADVLPLPYKQGVSSSSLLAPTLKVPSERSVSEHMRTNDPPIGSV